jgi:iron complex outermembrane receptor protein
MHFHVAAVVSLAAALPVATAAAQAGRDSARADSALLKLKPVAVTASRSAGVVGGASAVVIRPEELKSSPAPTLDQALRESPFVHVRQNSRGEMELSVRGSDSRQASVLLDGVPITLGWDHRTDPSLVPITGAQSVVIVRGLGSLLTGPNTLGGSIEVSHNRAFASPGSGRTWGGLGVDENSAVVASIDGLRTNTDLKETDGFASIRWGTPIGRGVGLTVTGFDAERGVPPEEHIGSPRLWRYPFHSRGVAAFSASTGVFSTPFGHGSLDVGVGYNSGRLKIEAFEDRSYTTVASEERGDERTTTGRALLTHSLGGSATLKAAATMADVKYTETLSGAVADYRQKLTSFGAEIEGKLGAKTDVAGGLVADKATTPETGGRTPGQEPFDDIGWRAGITHEFSGTWRVHASASQRSRFPALRELYSGALNRFRPNPELKPETLRGIEAGFTVDRAWGPIPSGTLQVTGFSHTLDDAVVRITLSNPTRFMRVNRDRIESKGAEVLAGFVFGDDRDRSVTLTADALIQKITLFDITVDGEPSRHAENNPEKRGALEIGIPLPAKFRAFANARYTGTQYCLNADTGDEMELEGKTRADLAVQRDFSVSNRGMRALVSFDNVTDAAIYDQCGLPQPGRTIRFMITLR